MFIWNRSPRLAFLSIPRALEVCVCVCVCVCAFVCVCVWGGGGGGGGGGGACVCVGVPEGVETRKCEQNHLSLETSEHYIHETSVGLSSIRYFKTRMHACTHTHSIQPTLEISVSTQSLFTHSPDSTPCWKQIVLQCE